MASRVVFLSIPGLRRCDLPRLPQLEQLMAAGEQAELLGSFPAVTWPAQANMLTGHPPQEHGVVANGFYWREKHDVEMWTAWNEVIQRPQVWDLLHQRDPALKSAVWFPMLSKGCGADYICMPAPIHNPDGSESLWCYTRPESAYGEYRDALGHFPLQHFWGPLANRRSTDWIVDSAIMAAGVYAPHFFYLYLPHLDYEAQKFGPDSEEAHRALEELDDVLGRLARGMEQAYEDDLHWLAASEYVIRDVHHVCFPNRVLRENGWLTVREADDGEHLDLEGSRAWTLVDHQCGHVFVRDRDPDTVQRVAERLIREPGIAEVLTGSDRSRYGLDHERSGDVVLVSDPESWQAYYWWNDDGRAPAFARTVDIHRKPGYDPVELFLVPGTRETPLDATLVRGSHGVPAAAGKSEAVLLSSRDGTLRGDRIRDTDVCRILLEAVTGGG